MTAASVLTVVRRELNDTSSTRWSDAVLLIYLSAAQRWLYELRSDLRLKSDYTVESVPGELTATSDAMLLSENHKLAVGLLTCVVALEEDSDDRGNSEKAQRLLSRAYSVLGLTKEG